MLLNAIRRLQHDDGHGFTVVEGPVSGAYFDGDAESLTECEAIVVEGDVLRPVTVPAATESGFTDFLDGIQRAEVKLYHNTVPIVYGYGAAAIRRRSDRQMRTLRTDGADWLIEREALFYPARYVSVAELSALGATATQLINTTPPGSEPLPLFPPVLYARAGQHVNRWRESLERELATRWCASDADGWLLVDGSITLSPELAACERAIGLIKSHRTRFFDGGEARAILDLKVGERSSVFEPQTRNLTPVRSFYLRLRPHDARDIFWGLVRVEMARTHDTSLADVIAGWLLAETAPISLPDARWDRLIYPIRDCEQFLRARAPQL
ncbi:MAG TPA: hypothetical protein VGD27_16000 [Longimicrobiales bacterium]